MSKIKWFLVSDLSLSFVRANAGKIDTMKIFRVFTRLTTIDLCTFNPQIRDRLVLLRYPNVFVISCILYYATVSECFR